MTRQAASSASPSAPLSLDDLAYALPPELIAQEPVEPRHTSRLLVYGRRDGALADHSFAELPRLLRAGDVLVRNDTRVFPARAFFRRATGGRREVLFLHPVEPTESAERGAASAAGAERWEVLLRGRPRPGEVLRSEGLDGAWHLVCERPLGEGRWLVASEDERPVLSLLEEVGVTPLPPYIHARLHDPERYQTTYASAVGSAAAPTAGLHFTAELDAALADAGVAVESLTLHVGLGTFKPLREEMLTAGRLHGESYEVAGAVWRRLCAARAEGRRVVAVGTTSLRTLEHLARDAEAAEALAAPADAPHDDVLRGETELFITPGFSFRAVDALLTNFHLPHTSLLALVMAFCGVEATQRIYAHAIAERYRFYSFGDAMVAL